MPSSRPAVSYYGLIYFLIFAGSALATPGDHREPEHSKSEVVNKIYPEAGGPSLKVASFNMAAARIAPLEKIAK